MTEPAQTGPQADDLRDAVAYCRAQIAGDGEAIAAIVKHCDPYPMTEALAGLFLGLLISLDAVDTIGYLDMLTEAAGELERDCT